MENKKIELGVFGAENRKRAADFLNKTTNKVKTALDQNDDGELNLKDASIIAETLNASVKGTVAVIKDIAQTKNRELELKTLQPIFAENLDGADFLLPKLVRITEMDKRRAESEVCKGSVGYFSKEKDLKVVNIFRDKIGTFGLTFYPDTDNDIYYVDPIDRDRYIAMDDYFSYLKTARVNELQKIAQDLGAKHFRVTFKEQKTTFSKKKQKGSAKARAAGDHADIDAEHELASTAVATVEIAAELDFPGHAPMPPELHYLQREPAIQTLISLRMDKASPLTHQKYTLKLSNSSGIKESDAIKIDAALKSMKICGNTTIASEVQSEARKFFEYEIDF